MRCSGAGCSSPTIRFMRSGKRQQGDKQLSLYFRHAGNARYDLYSKNADLSYKSCLLISCTILFYHSFIQCAQLPRWWDLQVVKTKNQEQFWHWGQRNKCHTGSPKNHCFGAQPTWGLLSLQPPQSHLCTQGSGKASGIHCSAAALLITIVLLGSQRTCWWKLQ